MNIKTFFFNILERPQAVQQGKAAPTVPVYIEREEHNERRVTTSEELKKSRNYANVPLGMD